MNYQSLKEGYELIQKVRPELVEVLSPRRYIPPQGFANPRWYSILMAVFTGGIGEVYSDKTMVDCRVNTYNLVRYDTPTYFVGHEFGSAVMATTLPDIRMGEIKMPLPAMLFVLEDSLSLSIFGRLVPFLSISKLNDGDNYPPDKLRLVVPSVKPVLYTSEAGVGGIVFHCSVDINGQSVDYSAAHQNFKLVKDVVEDSKFEELDYNLPEELKKINESIPVTKEEDISIINKATRLVLGLVMAMSIRPELVEESKLERKEIVKKGVVVRDALWSPNFLGHYYKAARELSGSHGSPRMHWRRGHYRNQPFGKNLAESKLIWIEPVLVNALIN